MTLIRNNYPSVLATAVLLTISMSVVARAQSEQILECISVFTPDTSASELAARFGAENLVTEDINLGEGFYEAGTVLFPKSPENRVEILWQDAQSQSRPRSVSIRGNRSNWMTPLGITLGTTLREVEAKNRFPFRVWGYGWDGQGVTASWGRGDLGKMSGCALRLRLMPSQPSDRSAAYRQVARGREYSSGHPAMQALDPSADRVSLIYDEGPR